jgi:hypothetical protein
MYQGDGHAAAEALPALRTGPGIARCRAAAMRPWRSCAPRLRARARARAIA